ncbi:MAG: NAD(P)H-dependent oxidoreductase subunit E [Proteobacteria bacterium]|nr:NAD(P)H-dependent oxidoreductase subunit E [Pseudomonadota bacterium]
MDAAGKVRVLLLARNGATAAPVREMERLCAEMASHPRAESVHSAFIEEGLPSFRGTLSQLAASGATPVLIVPLVFPAEATFETWLKRTLQRWQRKEPRTWPEIRIAPFPSDQPLMKTLLAATIDASPSPAIEIDPAAADGSVVPAQKRRALVCMGGPCNAAGAAVIWGHLRNEQKRLSLRMAGDGTMSAKTSCLGPCSLAPVLQVWPEGTLYGGVDEAGIDRIIDRHLLAGEIVEALAYHPTGAKQRLR